MFGGFTVTVTKKDGTSAEYPLDLDAMCEFETITGTGIPVAFSEGNIKMTHLVLLGWIAEKNSGHVVKPVDKWRKDIAGVDIADNAVPTSGAE